ncbi:MAG TPA: MmcQ/YjbR family DNA-binding protein [Longimicrobium sp.]|nr:MmcQ/YjbR family DNA-binding protein [Longimicrobium sp.]
MADPLDRLRALCLSLPEATEQVAWGEPTFRVKKKIFAMYASAGNHHGKGRNAVWLSAALGVQEFLVGSDPETYFVPPYAGVNGWIGVDLWRISDEDLRGHVVESYCRIAPKKLAGLVDG